MRIEQLSEELHIFKTEINAKLQANVDIFDRIISPKLDDIIVHQKETNGRMSKNEDKIVDLDKRVTEREVICGKVQEIKTDKKLRNRYIVTSIIAVAAILITLILKIL